MPMKQTTARAGLRPMRSEMAGTIMPPAATVRLVAATMKPMVVGARPSTRTR